MAVLIEVIVDGRNAVIFRQVWGWLTGGFAIASAAAGYLMSYLFDSFGSYYMLFGIGTVGLLIAMVLSVFVRNPPAPATQAA